MDNIASAIDQVFRPAGHVWETIGNNTGLVIGLTTDPELFWFRPAGFQIFEALCFFPLYRFLWTGFARPYISRNVVHAIPQRKPTYALDTILGSILASCFVIQVFIKLSRPNGIVQLAWLIMPCHVITVCWAFVLLQPPDKKNYATCRFVGAMMAMSSWGAVAATAFPDFSDQRFFVERVVFFIHHTIMLAVPHYWVAVHGLPQLSRDLLLTYCTGCVFFNYFVYTPLCYVVGVNINYNMYPHQALAKLMPFPMGSVWYRFFVPFALWIWGFAYYVVLHAMNRVYYMVTSGTSPPVSVSQEREDNHLHRHHHHRSMLSRSSSSSRSAESSKSPPPTEPSCSPPSKLQSLRTDLGDGDDEINSVAATKKNGRKAAATRKKKV